MNRLTITNLTLMKLISTLKTYKLMSIVQTDTRRQAKEILNK